jgi:aspartokinase/homoserine dehydrogenase 1
VRKLRLDDEVTDSKSYLKTHNASRKREAFFIMLRPRRSIGENMKQTLVMKFGGTSVGSVDALVKRHSDHPRCKKGLGAGRRRDFCHVWRDESAIGLRRAPLRRGKLIHFQRRIHAERKTLRRRLTRSSKMKHFANKQNAKINALILSLVDLCKAIAVLGEASPRALDAVASLGERMSVRLLAAS